MWYAVYTKPKKEDSVSFLLKNLNIEILNPKLKTKKFKRNKLTDVIEPLFPCYIFANFNKEKHAHIIAYTRGVRYIVGKENPKEINENIINILKSNMDADNTVTIKPPKFKRGERVYIREGPLKDFYGIFERELKSSERVIILLETINYKVEIDNRYITLADQEISLKED